MVQHVHIHTFAQGGNGSLTRRSAMLGTAALPLAGRGPALDGCYADPDATLLADCRRHLAAYSKVRSMSWPRDGEAVVQAVDAWDQVFAAIELAVPVTVTGRAAKLQAMALHDGPRAVA